MNPLRTLVETAFGGVARWRRGRAVHTRGVELDAELTLDPDSLLGRALDVSGSCPAMVRVSRSVGLPGRWPDLLGIAVRAPGFYRLAALATASGILARALSRRRTSTRVSAAGVRTPDVVVLGNGRAVVIEVGGVHNYRATRKADDADRDRHWTPCEVPTVRIGAHHADEPEALRELLAEELRRLLWRS
jgi:hypothetical protein